MGLHLIRQEVRVLEESPLSCSASFPCLKAFPPYPVTFPQPADRNLGTFPPLVLLGSFGDKIQSAADWLHFSEGASTNVWAPFTCMPAPVTSPHCFRCTSKKRALLWELHLGDGSVPSHCSLGFLWFMCPSGHAASASNHEECTSILWRHVERVWFLC